MDTKNTSTLSNIQKLNNYTNQELAEALKEDPTILPYLAPEKILNTNLFHAIKTTGYKNSFLIPTYLNFFNNHIVDKDILKDFCKTFESNKWYHQTDTAAINNFIEENALYKNDKDFVIIWSKSFTFIEDKLDADFDTILEDIGPDNLKYVYAANPDDMFTFLDLPENVEDRFNLLIDINNVSLDKNLKDYYIKPLAEISEDYDIEYEDCCNEIFETITDTINKINKNISFDTPQELLENAIKKNYSSEYIYDIFSREKNLYNIADKCINNNIKNQNEWSIERDDR